MSEALRSVQAGMPIVGFRPGREAATVAMARYEIPEVCKAVGLLARHGGPIEVRILNTPKGTLSGYFDNIDTLARAINPWDGLASVYVVMNEPDSRLLARSHNRLTVHAKATTTDADIVRRVWFLVDVDAGRPKGIAATDEELAAALARRDDVVAFLRGQGWPDPLLTMSGNGGHALYPIDEPHDESTTRLLERALKALAARFNDLAVTVDTSVFNAARIVKLPGTVAVKGDPMPDRPHRRARIEKAPHPLILVRRSQLEALAVEAPAPRESGLGLSAGRDEELDVAEEFRRRGWYRQALSGGKHAVTCPWADQHSIESGLTESALFEPRGPNAAWGFKCQHNHCGGRSIREVYTLLRGHTPRLVTPVVSRTLKDILADVRTDLEAGPQRVVSTPFGALNYLLHGGFHPGELVLLGARPGRGKSAFEMRLAVHAASEGHPVTVISREMSERALGRRLFAQEGGIHAGKLRAATLDRADWTRIDTVQTMLAALPIRMSDQALTIEQIQALARRDEASYGLRLLAVDYLQLVATERRMADKRLSVEYVSQGLKTLAIELKCVVLALSSLNRPMKGTEGRPGLHDLRESGALEHDADIAMFLHRLDGGSPEPGTGLDMDLLIEKGRETATGVVPLTFWGSTLTFTERTR